ncbi:hypothetical protein [Amycolatopsis antarctica]|uniref:hypothetical protein n=1 Tax=Amycolatopsis antarctica TaxID=1854586 RepID=UPI001055C365|nr:hypothetical protein [Amycolatopsis antarctica]
MLTLATSPSVPLPGKTFTYTQLGGASAGLALSLSGPETSGGIATTAVVKELANATDGNTSKLAAQKDTIKSNFFISPPANFPHAHEMIAFGRLGTRKEAHACQLIIYLPDRFRFAIPVLF